MDKTDYNAGWRDNEADPENGHRVWHDEADKAVGRNWNKILANKAIGDQAARGIKKQGYPLAECRSSDVAAVYLSKLAKGVDNTGIAKEIVGDGLGAALINVYQDTAPVHSNNESKASLDIYQDWVCPMVTLSGTTLSVGHYSGPDSRVLEVTGSMELE